MRREAACARVSPGLASSWRRCGASASCSGGGGIPECNDGADNDGDGLIDQLDPGCIAGDDEDADPPVACNDTVDNDGDGLIDFPTDPGCDSATDPDEFDIRTPDCRDGADNDADGLTDYPADPGCLNPNQDGEQDDCPRPRRPGGGRRRHDADRQTDTRPTAAARPPPTAPSSCRRRRVRRGAPVVRCRPPARPPHDRAPPP
jgi:hypothetical protein